MAGLVLSEVDVDLLCFVKVEDQVVFLSPVLQVLYLFSVGQFVVVFNEAQDCCVICIFQKVVCVVLGIAVLVHQGEQSCGMVVLNAELKSRNSKRTWVFSIWS